jgi:glycosyltransferase involved in cell wall biosynthesis
MTTPLVSVICTIYNHRPFIEQAIESFLMQQTNFPFEIILHDDASTDGTSDIIRTYAAKHPDLIVPVIQTENQYSKGVMPLGQSAITYARGKYVAWCEGDDYWIDPLKLQKQIDCIEQHPEYSMVFTNNRLLDKEGNSKVSTDYKKTVYTSADVIGGFIPGSQTMLFRNLPGIKLFYDKQKIKRSGDMYLSYFCSLFGDLYKLDDVTAVYRKAGQGVWTSLEPLEKIQSLTRDTERMHLSLGVPQNNDALAALSFRCAINTFTYCLKRPSFFTQSLNNAFIFQPFKKFHRMNRLKFVWGAILLKIKGIRDTRKGKHNLQN